MLAGGIGGTTGDILMHSLDTVKTRQQGDPHFPPKYSSLSDSYSKIFRQEGVRRGLYGGFNAAMLGSFPGTVVFFGTYEYCKRSMLDCGINPSISYLTSGTWSERMQLQQADISQASSQISLPLSFTCLQKSSKRAYSYKVATRIPSSTLATITDLRGMRQEPLYEPKDLERCIRATKRRLYETSHSQLCNLHSTNKSGGLQCNGQEPKTLASVLRLQQPCLPELRQASSHVHWMSSKLEPRRRYQPIITLAVRLLIWREWHRATSTRQPNLE